MELDKGTIRLTKKEITRQRRKVAKESQTDPKMETSLSILIDQLGLD